MPSTINEMLNSGGTFEVENSTYNVYHPEKDILNSRKIILKIQPRIFFPATRISFLVQEFLLMTLRTNLVTRIFFPYTGS